MFITSLNRMFAKHGRIAFGTITAIIIVTFVLYFSPGFDLFGLLAARARPNTDATSGISNQELVKQFHNVMMINALKYPFISLSNDYFRQYADSQSMQNAVLLREAAKQGINVGDKAVAEFEKDAQAFKRDGKFSLEEYNKFVADKLTPYRLTKEDLDMAVRQELIVKKLEDSIKSGVITTPDEIKAGYLEDKEKVKVKLFKFDKKDFLGEVKVDPASVESFFNAAKGNYKIAPRSKAQVFRFNYIDYEDRATKSLSEDEIKTYYDKKKSKYKEKDDKEVPPLEKVKEKLVKDLAAEKAKDLATEDAYNFANIGYDVFEKISDSAKTLVIMKEKAAAEKVVNVDTEWFGADDTFIKKIGEEPALVKGVAKVYLDSPISETVKGNKAAFVAFLLARENERPAEFAEVKDNVETDFKDEKSILLAREKAREKALAISKGLGEGKAPETLFEGLKPEDIKEFTADSKAAGPDSQLVTPLALETGKMKISEVKDTPAGTIFIFVENKTTPSAEDFKKDEAAFSEQYVKQKENAGWDAFASSLFKEIIEAQKAQKKAQEEERKNAKKNPRQNPQQNEQRNAMEDME